MPPFLPRLSFFRPSRDKRTPELLALLLSSAEHADSILRFCLLSQWLLVIMLGAGSPFLPLLLLSGAVINVAVYFGLSLLQTGTSIRVFSVLSLQSLTGFHLLAGGTASEAALLTALQLVVLILYRTPSLIWIAAGTHILFQFAAAAYGNFASWPVWTLPILLILLLGVLTAELAGQWLDAAKRQVSSVQRIQELERSVSAAVSQSATAAKTKNEFLANLSHEIRTPLNGVLGMTRLLRDTRLTAEQRELTQTLERSTKALIDVINEVLDFSKLESGRLDIDPQPFVFHRPFEDVLHLLGPIAEGKGIELLCEFDARVPLELIGDARRVRQVLINLVGNALKFTQHGHIFISTSVESDSVNQMVIRTEVSDTGSGIAPDEQGRLFLPFTQGGSDLVRKFGGTGLGLAICKRLVEIMGGEIGCKSTPGKGARFWFTIPFHRSLHETFLDTSPLHGQRVLVICRYSEASQILSSQLRQWGIDATPAFHAESAMSELSKARQQGKPYDTAIIDYEPNTPASSDSWLDRLSKAGDIRTIALLPYGEVQTLERTGLGGFDRVLTKPLHPRQLLAALLDQPANADEGADPVEAHASSSSPVILLVEDNPINQRVAVRLIELLGYRAELAANGRLALEAMAVRRYDAVLMDCMMPVMDGYEASREIRKREDAHFHIPIIAVTACVNPSDRQACLDAGMDDYITKPVHLDLLRQVLERWLQPAAHRKSKSAGND